MRKITSILTVLFACIILAIGAWYFWPSSHYGTIRVGILHSLTGPMALNELNVLKATELAIEKINKKGGVLGRKLVAVVADGKSDWPSFAHQAEYLITKEKVSVIFGCWTSASRKAVNPIVEKYHHLLFYPLQYEGLEESPNIIYTGAAPNQQIIPGVTWCIENLGSTFFLVGSDYVFPRTAHEIIKDLVAFRGGEILGEEYIPLGGQDVDDIVEKIVKRQPKIILNTINGDTNVAFFKALRARGISPEKIPSMSFSVAEPELAQFESNSMVGDYAAWNYFQSVDYYKNEEFVAAYKEKYGKDSVVGDPMEAAYIGVNIWSQTVEQVGSADPQKVLSAINNQEFNAPEGIVYTDTINHHTWKNVRIGKVRADGQFNIVWDSQKPIQPIAYPLYRSKDSWEAFLTNLFEKWGGQWAKPIN